MNFFARFIFIAFFTVSLSFVSCRKAEAARTELVFGTVCTVNAFDDGTTELYNSLFERLQLENLLLKFLMRFFLY